MIPPKLKATYSEYRIFLKEIEKIVRDLMHGFCDKQQYAFIGRTKELESLSEKVESGRFPNWSSLDDLYACTIIIPTRAKEKDVLTFLREAFDEVETRGRSSTMKNPSMFYFDSTRFIGRLLPRSGQDSRSNLFRIPFEVQIRTAFEHAWSVTTHSLSYKARSIDWRTMRLAAQLKAVVEQLDCIVEGFESTATFISEQPWPEVEFRKNVQTYFQTKIATGEIPSECAPSNWTKFTESFLAIVKASDRRASRKLDQIYSEIVPIFELEINTYSAQKFPRSISLFQFSVGLLLQKKYFGPKLESFFLMVTPELEGLYPASRDVLSVFDFNS